MPVPICARAGYNARGQLGHGTTTHISSPRLVEALLGKRVSKVACSYYHSIVATDNEQVFAFGRNDYGQLGCGDNVDSTETTCATRKSVVQHTVFSIRQRPDSRILDVGEVKAVKYRYVDQTV